MSKDIISNILIPIIILFWFYIYVGYLKNTKFKSINRFLALVILMIFIIIPVTLNINNEFSCRLIQSLGLVFGFRFLDKG